MTPTVSCAEHVLDSQLVELDEAVAAGTDGVGVEVLERRTVGEQVGVLAAPGIFHRGYTAARGGGTGPTASGGIDRLSDETGLPLCESERLDQLDRVTEAVSC